jgi:hypothetical protein
MMERILTHPNRRETRVEIEKHWCIEDVVETNHVLDEIDGYMARARQRAETR